MKERNISVWLPLTWPPTGDLAHNPGMCPGWESNWRPFGSQAGTQSTEPHQPELLVFILHLTSFYVEITLEVTNNISEHILNSDKN